MSYIKILHKFVPALTLIALTATTINSAQATQFYKWIDKTGTTHYTQEHPGKKAVKILKNVMTDDTPPPSVMPMTPASTMPSGNPAEQNANPATNQQTNTSTPVDPAAQPAVAPQQAPSLIVTPPPQNRLITPTQEQSRPTFSQN